MRLFSRSRNAAPSAPASHPIPPRFAFSMDSAGGYTPFDDYVASRKGLETYRLMSRDAEVSADMDLRLVKMMPGIQIQAADDTEEGQRAALFCDSVLSGMGGALLATIRDELLREAVTCGFLVAEPVESIINLPDFGGPVIGYEAIRVRPAEGFTDGIQQDRSGRITLLRQMSAGGIEEAQPEDVIYFAFHGSPWNPYGRSVLHAAYDAWFLKQTLCRQYSAFATVTASGLKEYVIPDTDFDRDKDSALARLVSMAERANIVRKKSHELILHIPSGDAGKHFVDGVRILCNAEIKKAILYDEVLGTEGGAAGTYGSKMVSQEDVNAAMQAQGWAFCEVMAEQILRRLLNRNGFNAWPTPRFVPEAPARRDQSPEKILAALGQAYTSGVITRILPGLTQDQILRQTLLPMGVDYEAGAEAPQPDQTPDGEAASAAAFKGAPAGRTRADVLKLKRAAQLAEKEGAAALLDAWTGNLPAVKKALSAALLDSSGVWKSRDFAAVRKAVEDSVTTGGAGINRVLVDMLKARYDAGQDDAAKMLPVRNAAVIGPVRVNPTQALAMLKQHVYLTMGETYTSLTSGIYYMLENALIGNISEREAMAQVAQYLAENGMTAGRATNIVNTSLAQAYNQGRMTLFAGLSDPDGLTPGGIIGYEFSAVMDDATTDECSAYDGRFFRVDDPSLPEPPLHYNCRSVLIPVFSGEEPWGSGVWTSLADSKALAAKNIMPGFGGN